MAPILLILLAPIFLGERLTLKKGICAAVAFLGMVLVSGVMEAGVGSATELRGILLGLLAAVLYACIVLLNKQLKGISAMERTILQLGISAIVLLPYCLLTVDGSGLSLDPKTAVLLVFVGVVHTGLAYALYFGSLGGIRGQTAAILSYIDPVVAVLASVLLLKETMLPAEALGAVLILGAAFLSEVSLPVKGRK